MRACVKRVGCLPLGDRNYVADPTKDPAANMDEFWGGQNEAHQFGSYEEAGRFVDSQVAGSKWSIERA